MVVEDPIREGRTAEPLCAVRAKSARDLQSLLSEPWGSESSDHREQTQGEQGQLEEASDLQVRVVQWLRGRSSLYGCRTGAETS